MDYYQLLGLQRNATNAQIIAAFRNLIKLNHPDLCDNVDSKEKARLLIEAYHTLLDPISRVRYDQTQMNGKKEIIVHITFMGQSFEFKMPFYEEIYNEIKKTKPDICSLTPEYFFKLIQNEDYNQHFQLIIDQLKMEITAHSDDLIRIIISLIQNIPYDLYKKIVMEKYPSLYQNFRHPYEVLYDNCGICSEKSILLISFLKILGYGAALFQFPKENHMAVGIKVPKEFEYYDGYTFIETTSPTIISDFHCYYGNNQTMLSPRPIIIPIFDGKSFDSVSEEYNDAKSWDFIRLCSKNLNEWEKERMFKLAKKYGLNTF